MFPLRNLGLEPLDLGILDVHVVIDELRAERAAEEWVVVQREAWRRQIDLIYDRLSQELSDGGELAEAIEVTTRWIAVEPLNESAYRRLMRLQAASRDRTAALRTYEACRRTLESELNAEPSPEIKVDEVSRLSEVRAAKATRVEFKLAAESATPQRLVELKSLLVKHPGPCAASLIVVQPGTAETRIALKGTKVSADDDLFAAIDRLFGTKVCQVR